MKMVARLFLILLAALIPDLAVAAPADWGVVIKGAFVIPSENLPWTDPEGRAAGKRIGYLRVGTVVRTGACNHVNGPDDESTGTYCDIQSEVGVEGKTLSDRIFPLVNEKSYAIARNEVILYDREHTNIRRESFSRNAGVIIEITGDWKNTERNEFVDVIATYNLDRPGTNTELAARKSDLIEKTFIVTIQNGSGGTPEKYERERSESGQFVLKGRSVSLWSVKRVTTSSAQELAEKVFGEIGWDEEAAENAEELISKSFEVTSKVLDNIFCVSDINADASAGFDFLGNSLKLTGKIPIYSKGKLFDFDVDVIEKDNVAQYWVLTAKTVVCEVGSGVVDSYPKAVEKVSIFLVKRRPPVGSPARLTADGARRFNLTIPDAVDAQNIPKLFNIEGFKQYIYARSFIADGVANSDLFDQMNREERIVLQHSTISKLAYFKRITPIEDIE